MKPPRDDASRDPTNLLFGAPVPLAETKVDVPIAKRPPPLPRPESTQLMSVAGLAQAAREHKREVRRHRIATERLVLVLHWLLGVAIVFVLLFGVAVAVAAYKVPK